MALSRIDTTNMIEDVPQSKLDNNINFRNIIINGDMSIAQRGTSATGLGNGDAGYHTCDRWKFGEGGSPTAEFTQSQSTDVPSGQGFAKSLKMDCTTAQASLGADDLIFIEHKIEGQNLQYLKKGTSNAQSLTASFWVKSNKTGNFSFAIYDNDNTRVIGNTYTINSASTWEKKTITFVGDTTGTLDNDNNASFTIWLNLFAGTNRSNSSNTSWQSFSDNGKQAFGQTVNLADSTSNEWYITGVQLEAGQTASEFEFLPHDVNLRRCQRYFQKKDGSFAQGGNTDVMYYYCADLFVEMRAAPTLSTSSSYGSDSGNSSSRYGSTTVNGIVQVNLTTNSGVYRGTHTNVYNQISFRAHLISEL